MAICLPGIASRVKRADDLGDAPRALGDDDEVDDHQDGKDHQADRVVAADDELAEGLDDLAGRVAAVVAFQQDHPGRGHVQRQAQQGRHQQHRREHGEVQRPQRRTRSPAAPPATARC